MAIFEIRLCTENTILVVDGERETLITGTTWSFSGESGELICGTVLNETTGIANFSAVTEYDGCGDCLRVITPSYTSNTIQEICEQVCDPISGGTTVVSVNPPHPVWTGLYGEEITQGNAVTLGGPNGLNS
jgi:hypothetical protein